MSEDYFIKGIDCSLGICKWLILQISLYFLMPYIWNYEYAFGAIVLICLYTSLYVAYWYFVDKTKRVQWILLPYLVYLSIATVLYLSIDKWIISIMFGIFLPLYGLICFLCVKLFRKYSKRIRVRIKYGRAITYITIIVLFFTLKSLSVIWMCQEHRSLDSERNDIIERKNYLV